MSVLVTGCAGFIAYAVCTLLMESGETVVGVDNLNDSYDPRIKRWRLDQLANHPRFTFHPFDIYDHLLLRTLFREQAQRPPFSSVVNLGARAGVLGSVEDPRAYFESNTIGALNLLELCKEFEVGKFVLASTSSVYGADTASPYNEDSSTSLPLSPYASSKKAAETLTYTYHFLHGLDATVLRFFTVYGPAGRPDMSIFKFIRAIAEGEPITLFGDGGERDFTFVGDVARGVVAATAPLGYEIINLGGDRPIAITDLISIIEGELGHKATIRHASRHLADSDASWADTGRARRLLGWQPQVSLEAGISLTARWYMQNRDWAKDMR